MEEKKDYTQQIQQIATAYRLAYEGIQEFLVDIDELDIPKVTGGYIGPMAAEIYRQMNRQIVVTVKKSFPKFANRGVDELKDALRELGYKGLITTGAVSYHFPDDDKPVRVELEKEAGCGHK